MESKGLKTITPIIITNSHAYKDVIFEELTVCTLDQELFTVVR